MSINPTYLGVVRSVSGSSVNVELTKNVRSGLLIIQGRTHRIGQVGNFVRIPQGYNSLYGIISETSESEVSENVRFKERRVVKVELVGESIGNEFERGISQFPSIADEVHLITEDDLRKIYGTNENGQIVIGKLSSSDSINVGIDLDALVNRHSAILGSTGSGKSTSVASLLRAVVTSHSAKVTMPSSRVILFDLHGEYSAALSDVATVFAINSGRNESEFRLPYWCVNPESLIEFLCGNNADLKNKFMDCIVQQKLDYVKKNKDLNLLEERVTPYTPIPFSLRKIWYDLVHFDNVTWQEKEMSNPAYIEKGDANRLIPPKFKPANTSKDEFAKKGGDGRWKKNLDLMKTRLLDRQYSFFLEPGPWAPSIDNKVEKDLSYLIESWIGNDDPITIFDLSGMPSEKLDLLLGSVLDVLFESAIWGRNLESGMKNIPLLLVMEEAHRYLSVESTGLSKNMVRRIAKEGRKFGVGSMLISQRPSEIDETILSQCGTLISLRISNASDRNRVKSAMSDGLGGIVDTLPILRTGEAIVTGEAVRLPMRLKFRVPKEGQFPNSRDPKVTESWGKDKTKIEFEKLAKCWRNQDTSKEES